MSRLAKKPITLPPGVFVKKEGDFWIFKGPKGELRKSFSDYVNIEERDGAFLISLLGVGGGLAAFPFQGLEIKVISLGLLTFLLGTRWLPVVQAGTGEEEHV